MLPPATRLSGPRIDSQPGLPQGGFASRSRAVAGPLASVPREGPWRSVVHGRVQGSSHTAGRPFRHLGAWSLALFVAGSSMLLFLFIFYI